MCKLTLYTKGPSIRERIPKKVYFVDTGVANINADLSGGAQFENTLCHQLQSHGPIAFSNHRERSDRLAQVDKLDVQGRIRAAVDQMDMREFHDMINDVAAQHLGAIQVLGYVLGAAVGALTTLASPELRDIALNPSTEISQ